jgi:RNA-binding, Nab2-type zinc finger
MMSDVAVHAADFTPGSQKAQVLEVLCPRRLSDGAPVLGHDTLTMTLKARLHNKLLELGYADANQPVVLDQLCEFISILVSPPANTFTNGFQIGNAKTKEQINYELSDLVGSAYSSAFTDWLFDEVARISNEAHYEPPAIPTITTPATDTEEPFPSRRDLRTPSSSARANAAPYPAPGRIVDQINRNLERKEQGNGIKHSIPDIPNVPTGPRASAAGPIRRGGPRNLHRGPPQPPVPVLPPQFAAFVSANGVPPELLQQMMLDAANFQMMQQGVFPPPPLAERLSTLGVDGSMVGRRRCRRWPRCNLGIRCTFVHPSEICPYYSRLPLHKRITDKRARDFPNCPNAPGTCLKIHLNQDIPESELQTVLAQQQKTARPGSSNGPRPPPAAATVPKVNGHFPKRENPNPQAQSGKDSEPVPLCKFANGCTKPDCPFAHPSPAAGPEGLVLRNEMCPQGRDCQNKECELGHPSPAVEGGARRKETETCKFFPNCHNPECPYKHPAMPIAQALSIPCKFGQHCTRPNCIYSHEIAVPCRYNPCLNANCPFQHEEGQQPNRNRVWTASTDRKFAVEEPSERVFVGGGGEEETVVHE